jgi:hypothetical protein
MKNEKLEYLPLLIALLLVFVIVVMWSDVIEKTKKSKEIANKEISNLKKPNIDLVIDGDTSNTENQKLKDSLKIKELKQFFRIDKDEYSLDGITWYKPKSAPNYINRNGLYCYFQTENNKSSNLRFRLQYYSDEWLFFNKVQFLIDEKPYEYIPSSTETDNGDGGHIWEWFDESVKYEKDKELIHALANAKSAKMKLIGRQYHREKNITKDQIKAIKQCLDLYNAMGSN